MEKYILRNSFVFTVILLLGFCANVCAQNEQSEAKKTVYIEYFNRPQNLSFSQAEALRNKVIEHIQYRKRIILIDVDSDKSLKLEQSRRESPEASAEGDMDRMKTMVTIGANLILQGRINSIATKSETDKEGKRTYTATCSYTLKFVNPQNGTIVASETNENSGHDASEEKAIQSAVTSVGTSNAIDRLLENIAPLYGHILEISKLKKDEAKEVYIDLGTLHGIDTETWFSIKVSRQIAGRTADKEIGLLKVSTVEGENISLCKVKKGGKELKAAMDQGVTITLQSKYVSTLFGIRI